MKQTITFHDNRNISKDGQNISLKIEQNAGDVTITLERGDGKPETCTFPRENGVEYIPDWFDHVETVASDAPMEYSEDYFSVCDILDDIMANHQAFQILTDTIYSMSGVKMTKPLVSMMGNRTLLELTATLGSTGIPGTGKKVPENAVQIINAELNKISKK